MKTYIIKLPLLYIALSFYFLLFTEGECNPDIIPSFKVTFDMDGGSTVAVQDIVQGAKATRPPATPAKEGYTFAGWFKADKSTEFDFTTETITANTTIYAKWVINSYTITFDTDGGTAIASVNVESGGKVTRPADPTKDGYSFLGWYKADKSTTFDFTTETVTATTITIYAVWNVLDPFTVDFNTNGGGEVASQEVAWGGKVTRPADPMRAGYLFEGWYQSGESMPFDFTTETITAATTIYAKWRVPNSEAQLLSFSFEHVINEGLLDVSNENINGTIDESAKTISFIEVSPYVQLDKLKASFTVSSGATVNIGDENQSTGETVNDFSSDITYEVVAEDGVTKQSYVVKALTKSTMATIPDATFRGKLKAQFPAAFTGDLLNINHSDVTSFTKKIDVSRARSIASLKGIEFFTSLTELACSDNQLSSLDVSKNTQLTILECQANELRSLDVSTNTLLTHFYCHTNQLSSLDVSTNTRLALLNCSDNQLSSLDVSTNTKLEGLFCQVNQLGSLDVSKNTKLTGLYCFLNQLSSLDVSKNTLLTILFCYSNKLTSLDMTGMRSILLADFLAFNAPDRTNAYTSLRVHENLKDHDKIKALKITLARTTISIYNADAGSTVYTLVCSDYNPNEAEVSSRCKN